MWNKAQGGPVNHRGLEPRFSSQMDLNLHACSAEREMEETGREKSLAALMFYYYIYKMMK